MVDLDPFFKVTWAIDRILRLRFPHDILRKNEAGLFKLVCKYIPLGASMGLYMVDLDTLFNVKWAVDQFS